MTTLAFVRFTFHNQPLPIVAGACTVSRTES